ncbi:hypothetical protein DERP_007700 [Dermatophagoides pteronyssinus]|uniref:Uncharacterized protein n=1 Tax=Dermatophagoides pteronyssinus TaxID=6956 RepID=A0ABQ8JKH3_DERPT|nr:hypothetical protein DERP_007700 [Dermatophagoides pteronyssinus]
MIGCAGSFCQYEHECMKSGCDFSTSRLQSISGLSCNTNNVYFIEHFSKFLYENLIGTRDFRKLIVQ